jgi:2-phosphosulfolactate phosphatase
MIDVALTLEELARVPLAGVTAVVIDVVRASTTIVTALAHGARGVIPVGTPEEAAARARAWTGTAALLGGERGGFAPPGFHCGNSPAEYTPARVAGRTVVLTTTNGTRALLAAEPAACVAVGAFVNAAAVVEWLAARPGDVLLVCAGETARFCHEDAVCAGLLVERLRRASPATPISDAARAAALLHAAFRDDLDRLMTEAAWARMLATRGQAGDLPLCAALDVHDVVPVARDGVLVRAPRGVAIDFAAGGPP